MPPTKTDSACRRAKRPRQDSSPISPNENADTDGRRIVQNTETLGSSLNQLSSDANDASNPSLTTRELATSLSSPLNSSLRLASANIYLSSQSEDRLTSSTNHPISSASRYLLLPSLDDLSSHLDDRPPFVTNQSSSQSTDPLPSSVNRTKSPTSKCLFQHCLLT